MREELDHLVSPAIPGTEQVWAINNAQADERERNPVEKDVKQLSTAFMKSLIN